MKKATYDGNSMENEKIVSVGSLVTTKEGRSAPEKHIVVDVNETNPRAGKISNKSPIGKALMENRAGDKITVETPGGTIPLKSWK